MSPRPQDEAPGDVAVTVHQSTACIEFVVPRAANVAVLGASWSVAPGAASRGTDGRFELLHIASGRWLVPEPTPTLRARLEALATEGLGALIDVEGKWRRLTLSGGGTTRLLASGISLAGVLEARDCALLRLFDSPVVLARNGDGFNAWVHASYFISFHAQLMAVTQHNAHA